MVVAAEAPPVPFAIGGIGVKVLFLVMAVGRVSPCPQTLLKKDVTFEGKFW